jgi:hypothetical protein
MKPVHLAALVAALSTFCPPSCSFAEQTNGFRLPDRNEPIYGTWINKDYSGNLAEYAQKWVYRAWGYAEAYNRAADANPSLRWTFILVEKWEDSFGNTWYKEFDQSSDEISYLLVRVSSDRRKLEVMINLRAFPAESEMNPKDYDKYRVFFRE